MTRQIQFLRLHITADDARALVVQDLVAFQRQFPGTLQSTEERLLREFFADRGAYGCLVRVAIEADEETWQKILAWQRLLLSTMQTEWNATAALIERNT